MASSTPGQICPTWNGPKPALTIFMYGLDQKSAQCRR